MKNKEKKNNKFVGFIQSNITRIARLLLFISALSVYSSEYLYPLCGSGIVFLFIIPLSFGAALGIYSIIDNSIDPKCKECGQAIPQRNEISGSGMEMFGFDILEVLFPVVILCLIEIYFFNLPSFSLHLVSIYLFALIFFCKLKKPEKSRESNKNVDLIKK